MSLPFPTLIEHSDSFAGGASRSRPDTGDGAQLVMITHRAREGHLQATVRDLDHLEPVHAVRSVLLVIRPEEGSGLA